VWDQMQGYDEHFIRSQDFELWSRIVQQYAARNLSQALVDSRRHPESIMARDQIRNIWLEQIISTNLARFSGVHQVPAEWAALLYSPFTGRVDEPGRLLAVVETIFSQFCDLHPDAAVNREIRRLRAEQRAKIAYLSAPHHRLASIRAYARACRLDPGVTRRISFPKYIALLMGGEFVRRKLRGA
jgi:hypothetical protein